MYRNESSTFSVHVSQTILYTERLCILTLHKSAFYSGEVYKKYKIFTLHRVDYRQWEKCMYRSFRCGVCTDWYLLYFLIYLKWPHFLKLTIQLTSNVYFWYYKRVRGICIYYEFIFIIFHILLVCQLNWSKIELTTLRWWK